MGREWRKCEGDVDSKMGLMFKRKVLVEVLVLHGMKMR